MKHRNSFLLVAMICLLAVLAVNADAGKTTEKSPLTISPKTGVMPSDYDLQDRMAVGVGRTFYLGGAPDGDNDGVADEMDDCPDTLAGVGVDQRGCWVVAFFGLGKAKVTTKYFKNLNQVVDIMKKNPDLKAEVQGHTCTIGSLNGNQKLSEKRAQAVYDYLAKKGVDGSRMSCKGYAYNKPAASNDSAAGKAHNRRTTLQPVR